MESNMWQWIAFNVFILTMLALDLFVFHRKSHEVSIREALAWTLFWVMLALTFNAGIYYFEGKEKALEFLTGYLIEKSLSADNIFVFILIFSYFNVPAVYQHKVLFWGIIGALVMRAIFIFAGIALIERFHWIIYLFAAFLVFTGIRMILQREQSIDPDKNPLVRLFKKVFRVTPEYHGGNFMVNVNGRRMATPLLLVLVLIEGTDLIFAVDSIPAILAISQDPFIVYTSNIFAILGLRALYFALAGLHRSFEYLKFGLAIILIFVGIKMFLTDIYHIPVHFSLMVIASILLLSILASIFLIKKTDNNNK